MEENMNFSVDQEPVQDVPAQTEKKNGNRIALIAGVAAFGIVLIVGIILLCSLFAPSPFEKTMHAVFPSTELYEKLMTKGGSFVLEGELESDLLGGELKEPVCFSADYKFAPETALFSLTAGAKEDRIDASLYFDREGMQVYSDRLTDGKAYAVWFDGLMDAIDASPFAPKSGTSYAMPRELYDIIEQYSNMLEQEEPTYEATAAVINKAINAMMEKADISTKNETVKLVDGETKAKMYTYKFDERAFEAFLDVIADEWENNDAFVEEIELIDSDGQIVSFIKNIVKEIELRDERYFEDEFEIVFQYAVKGGYLVYAQAEFCETDTDQSTYFTLRFCKNPKKQPDYELTVANDFYTAFSVEYKKSDDKEKWVFYKGHYCTVTAKYGDDDAFSLSIKYEWDVDVTDRTEMLLQWQLDLDGKLVKDKRRIDLTIDEIKYQDRDGNTLFEMTDSSFRFCIESGKQKLSPKSDSTDILGMDVPALGELGNTLTEKLQNALDSIDDKLGMELVHNVFEPNALASVTVQSNLTDYAYDQSNGHLFLAYSKGYASEIWMYDASTMELLDKLETDELVRAIDADGGRLVFVYSTTGQQSAYVYDSKTMAYITTIDYAKDNPLHAEWDAPGDIAIDGDNLVYISGDQHVYVYFTDLKTNKSVRSQITAYEAKLSLDRQNHIVALLDNNLSACDLYFYSTIGGKYLGKIDRFNNNAQYLKGAAHFDGAVFWATADEWYTLDGANGDRSNALDFDTHDALASVVYRDETIVVTLESTQSGIVTAFYLPDGTYCASTDVAYTLFLKADDSHYLVSYQEGNQTKLAYCELVEHKTIG